VEVTAMRAALIVVDVQRDFCPGGALPVKDGNKVVPGINKLVGEFAARGLPIFFTRDWHPSDHISFKKQGGPWPPHCVQLTSGAEFHHSLEVPPSAVIISKGDDPNKEAYSGFQGTDLKARLRKLGVKEVFVAGLATDYCVRESALDARQAGFSVAVVEDCTRAVDARPGDGEKAITFMKESGVEMTTVSAAVRRLASTQQ
jgi:nicotinamidase/pyrazinamidase